MDAGKKRVNKLILQVVETQLREGNPLEAAETFTRLVEEGISEEDARHLIGSAIVVEMRNVVETGKPFDPRRYVELLRKLPDLSGASEE